MALTGQLSDMSLAELIEFFCNQRKTGRLKVDYHRGHGVFFIKEGELVDAKVGALSGAEAVYFALTLPNAAFDFSADFEPTRRSIREPWTQVVLEGLRRLDEGASPGESDAFGADWTPSESDMALFMDHIERLGAADQTDALGSKQSGAASKESSAAEAPMSMMVESANGSGGGKKKLVMVAAIACVILACAVAAIPLARRLGKNQPSADSAAAAHAAPPEASQTSANGENAASADAANAANESASGNEVQPEGDAAAAAPAADPAAAALAARRERDARERAARERERKLEEARKNETAQTPAASTPATAAAPAPVAPAGPKSVRVVVNYDENGRVTQASVAGTSPGAEAYGATGVRVARGRRFPAGKAGSTVITIPIN